MNIDIRMVRTPALIALVAAGLCYGSLSGAGWFRETEEKEWQRQERVAREMMLKYQAAAEDVQQIAVYYPRFKNYKAQGIVGVEDRVLWVESLSRQARTLQFVSLTYSMAPPAIFSSPRFGKLVGADLFGSAMSVDMGLLHEEQLINLITGLQDDAKGVFSVDECTLERKGKGGRLDRGGEMANFTGHCRLMWFTIKGREGHWGESS
ncbi:MAG: hypothetical protein H7829_12490 [Magnetococcus sp. THC-1_WYH]